jgi:hypothetical protein
MYSIPIILSVFRSARGIIGAVTAGIGRAIRAIRATARDLGGKGDIAILLRRQSGICYLSSNNSRRFDSRDGHVCETGYEIAVADFNIAHGKVIPWVLWTV